MWPWITNSKGAIDVYAAAIAGWARMGLRINTPLNVHRFVLTASMVCAFVLGAQSALASPAAQSLEATPDHVRIVSWDLHDLWHQPGVPLRSGAQARTVSDLAVLRDKARALKADVIALQGIGSPRAARKLFPARQYYVVFSRELAVRQQQDRDILSNPARRRVYNAVVIRRAAKLRLLAREHILETADPSPALGPSRPQGTSAIAVKLRINKRPVWVVSSRLIPGCRSVKAVKDSAEVGGVQAGDVQTGSPSWRRSPACTALHDQIFVLNAWKSRKVMKQDGVVLAVALPQVRSELKQNVVLPGAWKTLTTSDPAKVLIAHNARKRAEDRRRGGKRRFVLMNPITGSGQSIGPVQQPRTVALTGPTRLPGQRLVPPAAKSTGGVSNLVVDALSDFARAALGETKPKALPSEVNSDQPALQRQTLAGLSRLADPASSSQGRGGGAQPSSGPAAAAEPSATGARKPDTAAKPDPDARFVRFPLQRSEKQCEGAQVGSNFLLVERALYDSSRGLRFDVAHASERTGGTVRKGAAMDCAIVLDIPRKGRGRT